MYFLALFLTIIPEGEQTDNFTCGGVIFRDKYYEKKVLFKGLGESYHLTIVKRTSELFFSRTVYVGSVPHRRIMACHVETKICREIPGITVGYAVAYHYNRNALYFGGNDGIYKYDFNTKSAYLVGEKGKGIWSIYIGRFFYYIEYPSKKLFVYRNATYSPASDDALIDNYYASRDDIYVSNSTALFKTRKATSVTPDTTVYIYPIAVRQIANDSHDDIYFSARDGIHMDAKPIHKVDKVADIDDVYGLTFVNIKINNKTVDLLVYSDKTDINNLNLSKNRRSCLRMLRSKP